MTLEDMENLIHKNIESNEPHLVHAAALLEIAYQLAKMNERMDKEDEKFFGNLPSKHVSIAAEEYKKKMKLKNQHIVEQCWCGELHKRKEKE